jgi:hypothetical protein
MQECTIEPTCPLWLPQERIVATGDVVTAPIPLMPSAHTGDYPAVLAQIKALGFQSLVPGHGAVQSDTAYLDLLSDTIQLAAVQMRQLIARGVSHDEVITKIDLGAVEPRFTHGDPFLANRFRDYLSNLPEAAYAVETGRSPEEKFQRKPALTGSGLISGVPQGQARFFDFCFGRGWAGSGSVSTG